MTDYPLDFAIVLESTSDAVWREEVHRADGLIALVVSLDADGDPALTSRQRTQAYLAGMTTVELGVLNALLSVCPSGLVSERRNTYVSDIGLAERRRPPASFFDHLRARL